VAASSGMAELADRGLARAIPLNSTSDDIALAIVEQLRHPVAPPAVELPTWDDCARQLADLYHSVARSPVCAF
jgi:hypothetical protein